MSDADDPTGPWTPGDDATEAWTPGDGGGLIATRAPR